MKKISRIFMLGFMILCCVITSLALPIKVESKNQPSTIFTYDGGYFTNESEQDGITIKQDDERVSKVASLNEGTITIRFRLDSIYAKANAVYNLFGLANPSDNDQHVSFYIVPYAKRIGMEQIGTSETNLIKYSNLASFKQDDSWQTLTITKNKDGLYRLFLNDGNVLSVEKSNAYPQTKFLDYFFNDTLSANVELNIGYSNRNLSSEREYHFLGAIDMLTISNQVLSDDEVKKQTNQLIEERQNLEKRYTDLASQVIPQAQQIDVAKVLSKELTEMITKLQGVEMIPTTLEEVRNHNYQSADFHKLQAMLASEEAINWVFTGDSITHGAGTAKAYKAYPEYFEQYLKTSTIKGINRNRDLVMNTGVANAVSQELINWQEGYILNKKPDVVFIAIGMNDQTLAYRDEGIKNTIATPQQVASFKERIQQLVNIVESSGAIPILSTQNHRNEIAYKANMDLYATAIREVAIENELILMDLNLKFLELNNNNVTNTTYMNDSVHPNYKGYFEWAKFIIEELQIKDETNELFKLTYEDLLVSYQDQNINVNNHISGLKGSQGYGDYSYNVSKLFDGLHYLTKDENVASLVNEENNITIRFKTSSNEEQTLISFTNKNNSKATSIKFINGMVRITIDENGTNQYYSKQLNITNDEWHTLSINLNANKATICLDGNNIQELMTNLSLKREAYDQLSIGASRGSNYPNGINFFKGMIDYVEISKRNLSEEEIKAVSKETKDFDASIFTKHFNNSKDIQMWSYIGGATLEGVMNEYSTKNFVQTFNEVYRWEAFSRGQIQRSKFYVNHAHDTLTMEYFNDNYDTIVKKIKQGNGNDTLTILPDLYNRKHELVEDDLTTFKTNLISIIRKAKADERTILLMTPAIIDEKIEAYVEAMKEIANSEKVALADSYQFLKDANKVNNKVKSLWFDEDGILNCVGQNQLARYLCRLMGFKGTQTFNLDYYNQVEIECSDKKVKITKEKQDAMIDVEEVEATMPYFFTKFNIYEVINEAKVLVASSNEDVITIKDAYNKPRVYLIEGQVGSDDKIIKYVQFKASIVDISSLEALIIQAKAIDLSNKTSDSAKGLSDIIKESEQLIQSEALEQAEVEQMIIKLQQAINNLEDEVIIYDDVCVDDWYYKVVMMISKLKLMGFDGKTNLFKPDKCISRGMIATIIYRMAKIPKCEYYGGFKDVRSGLWYSEAISWIASVGIVKGYDNGNFGVDDDITREDLAIILRNYAKSCGINVKSNYSLDAFYDKKQVSDYAQSALAWCVEQGIMSGSNHYLKPQGKATRAECAKMFWLLQERLNQRR